MKHRAVPYLRVHHAQRGLSVPKGVNLPKDEVPLVVEDLVRPAERVRCHDDVVHLEQRVVIGSRLLLENVYAGPFYPSFVHRQSALSPC